MTISSTLIKASYSGDGIVKSFAVTFKYLDRTHIVVTLIDALGVETVQVVVTNYTITKPGDSGTVAMLVAPPSGTTLVVARSVPLTQLTNYVENDAFPAESHEEALDQLTMAAQEAAGLSNRAPLLKISTLLASLPIEEPIADKLLLYNPTGDEIINGPTAGEIAGAEAQATAAAASATAASTSETNASTSETNAATSATASAASATAADISAASTFRKNAIINSDFNVWQRGTTFAAPSSGDYTADRFRYNKVGVMVHTINRSTDVPTQAESGFKSNYSIHVDCTTIDASIAAGDLCIIQQRIEGYNYKQFEGNTGTLSFWVKGTKTGIHCVSFRNSIADRSYVVEYTINTTNTWEKKTMTIVFDYTGGTWDYINGIGIIIGWCLAAGTTFQGVANTWNSADDQATSNQVNACDNTANDFRIAQVQFEIGAVASKFENISYYEQYTSCQRYYEHAVGFNYRVHIVSVQGLCTAYYKVEKRTGPAVTGVSLVDCTINSNQVSRSTFLTTAGAGQKSCSGTIRVDAEL